MYQQIDCDIHQWAWYMGHTSMSRFIYGLCHVFWRWLVTIENDDVSTNWLWNSSLSFVYGSYKHVPFHIRTLSLFLIAAGYYRKWWCINQFIFANNDCCALGLPFNAEHAIFQANIMLAELYCIVSYCIAMYSTVLHAIAWYCSLWYCVAWYCISLYGIRWYGVALQGIPGYCKSSYGYHIMVLDGILLYHMVLHWIV